MLHGNGGEGAAHVSLASSEASLCHDYFVQHDLSVVGNSVHFSTPAQTPSGAIANFTNLSNTFDPDTPPVTTTSCSGGQGIDCPPVARASADASPSCSSAAIKEAVSSSSESAFQFCPVYDVLLDPSDFGSCGLDVTSRPSSHALAQHGLFVHGINSLLLSDESLETSLLMHMGFLLTLRFKDTETAICPQ